MIKDLKPRLRDVVCNGRIAATGVIQAPAFSYKLESDGHDVFQKACRIIVSDNRSDIVKGKGNVWDSGYIQTVRTVMHRYDGRELESCRLYFYKIISMTTDGNAESRIMTFETGMIDPLLWKAKWIGGDSFLRKSFMISKKIRYASIYCTGLGYYELYINGSVVSDQTLSPSFVDYDRCVEYQSFNITKLLNVGENTVAMMLGSHWIQEADGSNSNSYLGRYYIGPLMGILQLHIEYTDGNKETVISDSSFKCCPSPVLYSSVYDGETFDARLHKKDVYLPGFDDSKLKDVRVFQNISRKMIPEIILPIRRVGRKSPKSIRELPNGDVIVDFGVNLAGRIQLRVEGKRGLKITLRHSELLNDDGTINPANLRRAKATDTYICAGEGVEIYEPRFTYHGFRYVCISDYPGKLTKDNIYLIPVRSSVKKTGDFRCSDKMLNQIHKMMVRTMSNNLHSIPTDCCQRDERQGWLGDGHITAEALISNFDMQFFYKKWLSDIFDQQNADTGNIEYFSAPGKIKGEGLSWTCAAFLIVYYLFRYYDDLQTAELYYDSMKKYFNYLRKRETGNGLLDLSGLDDWLGVEPTYEKHIRDALYFKFASIMSEIAAALGHSDDHEYFHAKSIRIKNSYNDQYYYSHWTEDETGYYGSCYALGQLNNALPLAFDMVEEKSAGNVIDKLIWQLTCARGEIQLTTGLIGTKYLFDALMGIGRHDIAYSLLKRKKYPSWGFMIGHGATTVWERWQYMTGNEMNSHDHPPLCAPDTWFYKVPGGIKDKGYDIAGIRVFEISPWTEGPIDHVNCSQDTPWGTVSVKWKKRSGKIDLVVTLPSNTKGILCMPELSLKRTMKNGLTEISVDLL